MICISLSVYSQNSNEVMILGNRNFQELYNNNEIPWFKNNYVQYNYNPQTIQILHNHVASDITFTVFGGSWCEDTQFLLPKFFKVLHESGFNDQFVHLYLVDRDKKSLEGEEEGLHITKVPTIIVYRNGNELGRIVEVVTNTIESDLVEILSRH